MELVEWHVKIIVAPADDNAEIPRRTAEEILVKAAIGWAERHRYGIGGGLEQNLENHWLLDFGLCATRPDQLIPYADACQLVEFLQTLYADKGIIIKGSVEAFKVYES